ncbi:hypothetical protein BUALT_Bualt02G0016000 [Buddleja alternifolia]|uniref:Uncharacterized protein n=1 Tax=Buddleja alternifolia TaxID=168488 RepID=A0AAV6Y328_9LAMI|nr:hypothetical protein BUALT_Bualt02G0016000 [Buddleja alternifolia]
MDFVGKLYKPWKPLKIRRKVRVTKLCKVLKPAAKIFKPLLRMLFPPAAQPRQPLRDEDLAFMTCVIKVDTSKAGWRKAVSSVLRTCRGTRFKMDENGVAEVSGIADPNKLLKKLGRSRRVEVQCAMNALFVDDEFAHSSSVLGLQSGKQLLKAALALSILPSSLKSCRFYVGEDRLEVLSPVWAWGHM